MSASLTGLDGEKSAKPKTTTIQVKRDLKDKLDLLKIFSGKEDLNALIAELLDFYAQSKNIEMKESLDAFLKRLKK